MSRKPMGRIHSALFGLWFFARWLIASAFDANDLKVYTAQDGDTVVVCPDD